MPTQSLSSVFVCTRAREGGGGLVLGLREQGSKWGIQSGRLVIPCNIYHVIKLAHLLSSNGVCQFFNFTIELKQSFKLLPKVQKKILDLSWQIHHTHSK